MPRTSTLPRPNRSYPEYSLWANMKSRCRNPRHQFYRYYGGRGIAVCPTWRTSFAAFRRDMGPRPGPTFTLDRIDNNQGYHPGNCRWATRKEQTRNRRSNVYLTFGGRTMVLTDWALALKMPRSTLQDRLSKKLNWTVEEALGTPSRRYTSRTLPTAA